MTDPIEAVARALHARPRHYSMPWDELVALADNSRDPEQSAFVRLVNRQRAEACAAIAAFLDAVREPSANAKDAGTEVLYGEDFIGNPKAVTTAVETWQAMIDALRAELLPSNESATGDVATPTARTCIGILPPR